MGTYNLCTRLESKSIKARLGPDGVHLFDRRSGVNILVDELDVPEERYSRAPRFVSFALTNACNLDCPFCYAPKHAASLEFDKVVDWAIELDRNGALGIGFGGGEPTLYPRFSKLCATLAAETELAIGFTTHAHQLTPTLRDELAGVVHFIRVSMDGVGATYEGIRGRSFPEFLRQLQLVSQICEFGVNFVVNDTTVSQLDEAARTAFDLGATEFLLLPDVSVCGLSELTRRSLARWVSANCGRFRLAISEVGVTDGIPIADPFIADKGTKAYIHVNASGQVSGASYNHDGALAIKPKAGILAAISEYQGLLR